MARIRYLKPDFFTDEDLGALPFSTRLTYAGLWIHADRAGRLEDRPKFLKAMLFPYDEEVNIDQELDLLVRPKQNGRPFILRYCVESTKIIQILAWEKHQKPHHTERPSILPEPPENIKQQFFTVKTPLDNGSLTGRNGEGNGEEGVFQSEDTKTVTQNGDSQPNKRPERPINTFSEDSDAYRLAAFLLQKITDRKPNFKKPNLQEWAEAVDRMLRIDGRSPKAVENVICWCQGDDFWQNNILSPEKLRKQFDQLELKMEKETGVAPYRKPEGVGGPAGAAPPKKDILQKIREARKQMEDEKDQLALQQEIREKGEGDESRTEAPPSAEERSQTVEEFKEQTVKGAGLAPYRNPGNSGNIAEEEHHGQDAGGRETEQKEQEAKLAQQNSPTQKEIHEEEDGNDLLSLVKIRLEDHTASQGEKNAEPSKEEWSRTVREYREKTEKGQQERTADATAGIKQETESEGGEFENTINLAPAQTGRVD